MAELALNNLASRQREDKGKASCFTLVITILSVISLEVRGSTPE
jgi:hypothetical protein